MTPELTDIDGIGDARSETMAEEGYDSVEEVANADPTELAENIPRVTADRATNFVLEAENLLDGSDTSDESTESSDNVLGPLSDSSDSDEEMGDESDEFSESSNGGSEEIVTTDDATVSDDEGKSSDSASDEDSAHNDSDTIDGDSTDGDDETVTVEIERDDDRVEEEIVTSLVEARRHYSNRNPERSRQCENLLEQYQENGLSFELTQDQLNVFHASVKNRENTYKGNSQLERMRVLMTVREQIQQFR